jgi:hypothetical protein
VKRITVVTPIWMQDNLEVLEMTKRCVASIRSPDGHGITIRVVCTRLHLVTPKELQQQLQSVTLYPVHVMHEENVERCVAAAWNWGIAAAMQFDQADYLMIVGNDTELGLD